MLALLRTLFDIVRLRKGPDAIPYSWLVCFFALLLWLFAGLSTTVATPGMSDQDFLYGTFTGVVGLAVYAAIVVTSGHTPRLLQTVTAILGSGAIISFMFLGASTLLPPLFAALPFLGQSAVNIVVTLVLLWSIPVEGHIIARAIDRHWYLGIAVAMAVFIFQLYLYSAVNPNAGGTT
jgi:hypothetical protein